MTPLSIVKEPLESAEVGEPIHRCFQPVITDHPQAFDPTIRRPPPGLASHRVSGNVTSIIYPYDEQLLISNQRHSIHVVRGFRVDPYHGPEFLVKFHTISYPVWVPMRCMIRSCPTLVISYLDQAWPYLPLMINPTDTH